MNDKIDLAIDAIRKSCAECDIPPEHCHRCTINILKNILIPQTIYGIDFDGTIVEEAWPQIGKVKEDVVCFIRELKKKGHRWVLITMREGKFLDAALDMLAELDIYPDAVNDNLPERIEKWGNNPRKIYADVYIDDHNAGGLILPEIPEKKWSC